MSILVIKFGGTSIKYGINNIIDIINYYSEKWDKIIIVLSALSQVTNLLIDGLENNSNLQKNITEIRKTHKGILESNCKLIDDYLSEYDIICNMAYKLKNYTPLLKDKITSYGEFMSVNIVSEILKKKSILHRTITSDEFIITDDTYGEAYVNLIKTNNLINSKLLKLFDETNIILTTGFIGRNENNILTTLGRGGSDYTATLIGSLVKANEILIFSDVNGFLTADPKKINSAQIIKTINIKEAAELSFFGAKIIHPKTIQPLIKNNIPLRILNTFDTKQEGTLIYNYNEGNDKLIKGITSINNINLFSIEGTGILGKVGILSKIFKTISDLDISIPFITQASSETTICFAIKEELTYIVNESLKKSLEKEINSDYIQKINIKKGVSLITIVGNNMKKIPGVAGKIFHEIGENKINIIAISQGSSEISITMVISESDEVDCIKILHRKFIEN